MIFFLQTASQVFKAFGLFIMGDEEANEYIHMSQAHWLLSWLMVIAGSFIYLLYLPNAFVGSIAQEVIPKTALYSNFKSANMISLTFNLLTGYFLVYLFEQVLKYQGSVRRYIIAQNWVFLISIIILVPLSTNAGALEEGNPFMMVFLSIFIFILFFGYRSLKITLRISGPKAFLLMSILLTLEIVLDSSIDRWFGLVITASS